MGRRGSGGGGGGRTLAALKALLQDALPEVDVGTVRLEVGGRELADDDDVCGLEAGSVVELSVTAAALAAATLREERCYIDFAGFCDASQQGDVRRCGLYLDAGVACIHGEKAPLHYACEFNRVDVARLLLDRGAAIDEANAWTNNALHIACLRNHVEIATLLLDRGADVDTKSSTGDTPLHLATLFGHVSVVRLLLDRGCAIPAAVPRGTSREIKELLSRARRAQTASRPHTSSFSWVPWALRVFVSRGRPEANKQC